MNIIDIVSLAILALFVLGGIYKGFLSTLLSIGSYFISVILGFLLMPIGAGIIRNDQRLFNMMLYYTEGSEFIANPEFVRSEISSLSSTQISDILDTAHLPFPMGKQVASNIAKEAFAADGIISLGDYFNQTIVLAVINILMFLAFFLIIRMLLGFVINGADYAEPFPVLRSHEGLLSAAAGFVRGLLALFLLFMLVPIGLTVLGQFDLITSMVDDSIAAGIFYKLNILLNIVV